MTRCAPAQMNALLACTAAVTVLGLLDGCLTARELGAVVVDSPPRDVERRLHRRQVDDVVGEAGHRVGIVDDGVATSDQRGHDRAWADSATPSDAAAWNAPEAKKRSNRAVEKTPVAKLAPT